MVSLFYVLVFSVFNVLMCFKIVFGLNTYSVTIDLDQTERYFVRWWIRVYNISHKREILSTLEDKFVLTHGQVMSPQGCQKDFL